MSEMIIGKTISHYKILEKLGEGGMGVVYKAEDTKLGRTIALKFLPPVFSRDEEAKTRFIQEAQAASALDHNNICNIHEINETEEGQLFISMALYKGETLKDKIAKGPIEINEVIDIALQICEGLEKAHKNNIVHRDIKPANIFITTDGIVKILDFGLAKVKGQTQLTKVESTLGTVDYMSPEQANGTAIDKRTDIWSVGVVLYEMIIGRRPFAAEYEQAVIYSILNNEPEAIPEIDARLQQIISKALAKNLNDRYQSTGEIVSELNRIKDNQSTRTVVKKSKLHWIISAVVVIVMVVLIYLFLPLSKSVKETETIKTIAVLPFVNISPDPNQEYFSDGLSEELINTLSRNPKLRVIARTSSFYFKGTKTNIKTIAQTLNVNHILEGSVRKSGNNLRINADLVNAETDATLWSNTYNGTMDNIFALQDSISGSVAKELNAALLGSEGSVLEQKTKAEAYNLYLLGNHFRDMSGKQNWERAISYYKQALSIDSTYAPAWAELGTVYLRQGWAAYLPVNEIFPKARKVFEKALELDPNLARAYDGLAWIKMSYDFDWQGAEELLKPSLVLEAENESLINSSAILDLILGHFDKAIKLFKHAVALDPVSDVFYYNLGLSLFYGGLLDEAIAIFRKGIELEPQQKRIHTYLSQIYIIKGQFDSALTEIKQEIDPHWQICGFALVYFAQGRKMEADDALQTAIKEGINVYYQIAEIYAFRDETDKAFEWLERSYNAREDRITTMKGDPLLKNIRKDPRYAAFMKKMKLPL